MTTHRFRLVSLNAWGGALFDELAGWLRGCDADVVCLQEVTRTPGLRGPTHYADADRSLPQRADLYDDVTDLLPHHHGHFAPSDAGPVVAPDEATHRQQFGIATFVHRRHRHLGHTTRFVHGTFTDHDHWPNADRPRVAHATRLHHHPSGRQLTVVHLHGLRDPAGKADTPARIAQAERLAELIDDTRHPGDLTIVCGDLNVLPDSATFAVLAEIGLTELIGPRDTRTRHYPKPVRHASYVLVSDPEPVTAVRALATPEVSDHRIIQLDLALEPLETSTHQRRTRRDDA
jgi:endonuclease/exonuclease/phosphatase family metal-dependent hydrolase